MNLALVFDTETTGLPLFKEPSEGDNQPHIVQLAASLVDLDTQKVVQSMDVIIKPDGWIIPDETAAIHGITTEHALAVGIPEKLALEMFLALWAGRIRIAHNTTFDNRIIRIATKRFCSEEAQEQWHAGEYFCTMVNARKVMPIAKNPTLGEAYQHFTGKELVGAHSALADANACMEVYFAAKAAQAVAA
jgi:DNA polymerase-3 subunit epsilon